MRMHSFTYLVVAMALTVVTACGERSTEGDAQDTQEEQDVADDVTDDGEGDAEDVPDAVDDVLDVQEEEVVDPGPLSDVALPQAVDGAMWANPDVYTEIPLHVAVTGLADAVTVTVDGGDPIAAQDDDFDQDWVAMVPIDTLADGMHDVEVSAVAADVEPLVASAQLGTGTEGVQLTDFSSVGMSGVPRLHRVGDEAYLTWTDRSATDAEAWLRKIDGAARWTTDRVALVGAEEETLYSRSAVGDSSIGLLYQAPGGMPYVNHFKIVDTDGTELMATMDLDPEGFGGSFGGDIAFDGSGYVMVWRVNDGAGASEVRWMRVDETTHDVTGPVVVAAAGEGIASDPVGGFDPFSFMDVAVVGDLSMVSFVRYRFDTALAMEIPKAQLALISDDGTIEYQEFAGRETAWTWDRECRAFDVGATFVAVWSEVDLTDPDPNSPNAFHSTRTDGDGSLDPTRGGGVVMLDQVDDRDEPFLLAHPDHLGVLAWWDHRAYTLGSGGIRLYAAPVTDELTTIVDEEVVFEHGRCIAGTTHLHAAPAGTNVLLVWIDERHGGGVMDPRPEVYFETVWF